MFEEFHVKERSGTIVATMYPIRSIQFFIQQDLRDDMWWLGAGTCMPRSG